MCDCVCFVLLLYPEATASDRKLCPNAGGLSDKQAVDNPYLAAQRRARQEAGLSQQQRRLQQWAAATAGELTALDADS